MVGDLTAFIKILVHPPMFLPLLLNLALFAVPQLGDAGNYILLNEGGWDVADLSVLTLTNGLLFSISMLFLLKEALSKLSFVNHYLVGAIMVTISNMTFYTFLYSREIGFYGMFAINFLQAILINISSFLPQMATIGRFTTYLPEGFESTGVTILVSICNVGIIGSGLMAAKELVWFDVKAGYYKRTETAMHFNVGISALLVLICPLFVVWKVGIKKTPAADGTEPSMQSVGGGLTKVANEQYEEEDDEEEALQ